MTCRFVTSMKILHEAFYPVVCILEQITYLFVDCSLVIKIIQYYAELVILVIFFFN